MLYKSLINLIKTQLIGGKDLLESVLHFLSLLNPYIGSLNWTEYQKRKELQCTNDA